MAKKTTTSAQTQGFTIQRSDLLQAIDVTSRIVNRNAIVPMLSNLLFEFSDTTLTVTGSNLQIFILCATECIESTMTQSIAVPEAKISQLIKSIPDQAIEFTMTGENTLHIKTSSGKYNIPVDKGDDFPTMKLDNLQEFTIPSQVLYTGIARTSFVGDAKDPRQWMDCVYMAYTNEEVSFTSCDGHNLSNYTVKVETEASGEMLLPRSLCSVISGLSPDDKVIVKRNERNVSFQIDGNTIIRAIFYDDRFPDWKSVIPFCENFFKADPKLLLQAIKRVIIFSNSVTTIVKLSVSTDRCVLSCEDVDLSWNGEEVVSCVYTGEPIIVALKGKQLVEYLSRFDGSEVIVYLKDERTAAIFRAEQSHEKENLFLTMPCVINE